MILQRTEIWQSSEIQHHPVITTTGCIKKLYTLGFVPNSQQKIRFQQWFCTCSMCQTHEVAKHVKFFISSTKSDQDIEKMVKRTPN